jgi:biopolymer transport protein ExbB/TolQ
MTASNPPSAANANDAFVTVEHLGHTEASSADATPPMAADEPRLPTIPDMPRALADTERRDKLISALLAIGLAIGLAAGAFQLSPRPSALAHMLDPSNPATLIPVAITALFLFGVALVLLRGRRITALRSIATRGLAVELAEATVAQGHDAVYRHLDNPVAEANPLLRRTRAVLLQWKLEAGRNEAGLALQHHIDADTEAQVAAYNLPRTIVWALPVLGLVGTVIGIAGSVGGFSTFLAGSVEDVSAIKRNLVDVTGGLSFAFLLTLQGLITSLLLMFQTAAAQGREERLEADVQGWMSDIVLPAVQRAQPARPAVDPFADSMKVWQQELRDATAQIVEQLAVQVAAHTAAIAQERQALATACDRLPGAVEQAATAAAAHILTAGKQSATKLSDSARELATETAKAFASAVEQCRLLQGSTKTLIDTQARQQQQLQAAIAEQAQALAAAGAGARDLVSAVQLSLQTEREALATLRDAAIAPALVALGEQIAAQVRELQAARTSTEGLTNSTRALAASHAAVQDGIKLLAETGFKGTLRELGQAIADMRPVLEHFQQPFVLTAAPVGKRANGA